MNTHLRWWRPVFLTTLLAAASCTSLQTERLAATPAASAAPAMPVNASILRSASGSYRYESISNGAVRGSEHWQFFAHPDGSRSMLMWHDLAARNAQFSVMLRVAPDFRPLEAFASYWNGGAFKGSGHIHVNGKQLRIDSAGPWGERNETVTVPDSFSIGTHPVAGDGWHSWPLSLTATATFASTLYALEASADLAKPVLGALTPLALEVLGAESITVPAGRFDTVHLRIAGMNDLWITPQDRLVVKSSIPARDLQYLLVEASGTLR